MSETIIGKTLIIEGEISGEEPLIVLGTVKGKIQLKNTVSVAEGGRMEADVIAGTVEISGAMTGNVQAIERMEIKAGGRMQGDIRAPRVLIADGALFKGNVDMDIPSNIG